MLLFCACFAGQQWIGLNTVLSANVDAYRSWTRKLVVVVRNSKTIQTNLRTMGFFARQTIQLQFFWQTKGKKLEVKLYRESSKGKWATSCLIHDDPWLKDSSVLYYTSVHFLSSRFSCLSFHWNFSCGALCIAIALQIRTAMVKLCPDASIWPLSCSVPNKVWPISVSMCISSLFHTSTLASLPRSCTHICSYICRARSKKTYVQAIRTCRRNNVGCNRLRWSALPDIKGVISKDHVSSLSWSTPQMGIQNVHSDWKCKMLGKADLTFEHVSA